MVGPGADEWRVNERNGKEERPGALNKQRVSRKSGREVTHHEMSTHALNAEK